MTARRWWCLKCGERDDIVVDHWPTGLVVITCTCCREISMIEPAVPLVRARCADCGWLHGQHAPGCARAPDQQLWGV